MKRPPPQAIVVFGASGDLTRRQILPSLFDLSVRDMLPDRFVVLGYSRTEWTDGDFRRNARKAVDEFASEPVSEDSWRAFEASLHYAAGGFDEPRCFRALEERLERVGAPERLGAKRLYYCATPPAAFPSIVRHLGELGPQAGNTIVVEKPFGSGRAGARALNGVIHEVFDESQVYRIDHYLGKETVQNILVLRFANALFERVWHRDAIDHVQITVAESLGIGDRGAYYESAGALRDILQNHMLQVVGFLAMEPPGSLDADAVRDEKVKVLRAMRPLDPSEVVRGQYVAGEIDGEPVAGYRDEARVGAGSQVETFVAARAWIDNWRWQGVPFYLRTGKRMARRATEVVVQLRDAPAYLFEESPEGGPLPDHLAIRLQPDEGISFAFQAKQPGPGFTPATVRMDFSFESFFGRRPDAYERLLHDAMSGDRTLFTREDEVERAWEIVEPALDDASAPSPYPAGSWGPPEADALMAPRRWHLA